MKNSTAAIIFFVVLCLSAVLIAGTIITAKQERMRNNYEALCAVMTDELNNNINENSTCVNHYCYYAPYETPEGELGEKTVSLCACECELKNGTIITIQVLGAK